MTAVSVLKELGKYFLPSSVQNSTFAFRILTTWYATLFFAIFALSSGGLYFNVFEIDCVSDFKESFMEKHCYFNLLL